MPGETPAPLRARRPKVTLDCVAHQYAERTERIVEVSVPGTDTGCLVSFWHTDDRLLKVDVYRASEDVSVVHAGACSRSALQQVADKLQADVTELRAGWDQPAIRTPLSAEEAVQGERLHAALRQAEDTLRFVQAIMSGGAAGGAAPDPRTAGPA